MALVFNIPVFGFQSTLPRRERLGCGMRPVADFIFQSTLPRRERPCRHTFCVRRWKFQSTLPRRERLALDKSTARSSFISIHAPAKGATSYPSHFLPALPDFNPRSREGSDLQSRIQKALGRQFQSTLPRRERQIL